MVRDFAIHGMFVSIALFRGCGLHFGDCVALRGPVQGGSFRH
jgi:hypothetical protein